ncbi:MAG: TIGR04211 family SH3 domain-containing protein [Gammaproteobacteria bacterium]|nr:TIGR04211 family SH3 domain-containing protein [Gammaproteobacteria bacterium]MCK5092446.1 TIGR04211 family SH3 domain-containing protein [Gammaproteobacteria bacterium]
MKYIIFLITLISIGFAQAETVRYVSDQLKIPMRSGQSDRHKILRFPKSGNALVVLETNEETGYSLVRTQTGKEGWVLSKDLMAIPSARDRLADAEEKMSRLREIEKQMAALESERNQLNSQNVRLNKQLAEIRRVSSNAIQISEENETLRTKTIEMERNIQLLQQENDSLQDRSYRNWFMTGAAVVIVSMLFGILLTRIRWRKKSSWGDL